MRKVVRSENVQTVKPALGWTYGKCLSYPILIGYGPWTDGRCLSYADFDGYGPLIYIVSEHQVVVHNCI